MFSDLWHRTKFVLSGFEDLVFPQVCNSCSTTLENHDVFICQSCLCSLPLTHLGNWYKGVTENKYLDFAVSAFWYNDLLNRCIHKSKYSGYKKLLNILSVHAARNIHEELKKLGIGLFIPVPLHRVKKREREYNQADIISDSFSKVCDIPFDKHVLSRIKWTESQTRLNVLQRSVNVTGVFNASISPKVECAAVVDDVLTTGATSNECCRVLKEAGINRVGVITLATPQRIKVKDTLK